MQPEGDSGLRKQVPNRSAAGIIERLERIRGDVGLRVDDADTVLRRPADTVLERQTPAKIDADPVLQCPACHALPLRFAYFPVKFGFRFSMKARRPSI